VRQASWCDPAGGSPAQVRGSARIPIVFAGVGDPVASGFVAGLPRPGGNITGFTTQEPSLAGKWLGLLTEIAPIVKRVGMMFNPDTASGGGSYYLQSFEAAARSLKVEPIAASVHSDAEIETVMTSLGREPRGGLVVMPDVFNSIIGRQLYCWQPETKWRWSMRGPNL
jgi:putative tryptophan/tyrosine transport system substrate-binding protein